jgi:hypothetical protein
VPCGDKIYLRILRRREEGRSSSGLCIRGCEERPIRIALIRQSPCDPSAGMVVDWRESAVSRRALSHVVERSKWLSVVVMEGAMGTVRLM